MSKLSINEEKLRNIYLRGLLTGDIQGPLTGYPHIDKPHLRHYSKETLMGDYPKCSMYDYLYECSKNNMNDVAIVFDTGVSQTPITYKELFKNIDLVAEGLLRIGIKPGENVAISFANIPESAYTIYALNKIGAVTCLLDPRSTPAALERDLKSLGVKTFIGISETYKNIKQISGIELENIVIVPAVNSEHNKFVKVFYNLSKLKEGNFVLNRKSKWKNLVSKKSENISIKNTYKNDRIALISYTGGTTGIHKGVKLSDDSMNTLMFAHKELMQDLSRGDIFMNILPQFMIYGVFTLHLGLTMGLKTYMVTDPSPEHFIDYLMKINPAMVFGGPVHWETLIDNPKLKYNSLNNLLAAVSGGEKLSKAKEEQINEALKKACAKDSLCNGFGASELNGSVTLKRGNRSKAGTVGFLHPYDNAKIVDCESGKELGYNESGALYISTPSMMLGYYNNEEEEKKAIKIDENGQKWFVTGDLAKIYENGDIEITGRSKRLFVCGLNNVYPPELEEIIYKIPNVKKCAVVNVPDDILREVPKVHIVLENDTEEERKKVVELIKTNIACLVGVEVLPHYYEFHDELKYTPNGKIDFDAIRNDDLKKTNDKKIKVIK